MSLMSLKMVREGVRVRPWHKLLENSPKFLFFPTFPPIFLTDLPKFPQIIVVNLFCIAA